MPYYIGDLRRDPDLENCSIADGVVTKVCMKVFFKVFNSGISIRALHGVLSVISYVEHSLPCSFLSWKDVAVQRASRI